MVGFIEELKRRRVVRVLVVYLASAFAILEATDILIPALSLPAWLLRAVIGVLGVGLVVTLLLSWIYDITLEGVVLTESADGAEYETSGVQGQVPAVSSSWLSPASVVLAILLVAAGAIGTSFLEPLVRGSLREADSRSVAVLPLADLSPDEENRFFADGIHEDLLTQLSKIADLKVISRASVLDYRSQDTDVGTIASELGVATVMLGSVRRADDRVRVSVQLVDPRTGENVWADTYDRTVEDVFAIQMDIALSIAEALAATLSSDEEAELASRPTESLEAYDHFLRGSEALTRAVRTLDPTGLGKAASSLEQAVRVDAEFGVAHAYLSVALEWTRRAVDSDSERASLGVRAADHARRALQLDPAGGEAHFAAAFQNGQRPESSARTEEDLGHLRIALDASPNSAATLREMAVRLEWLGRIEEAATYSVGAAEREPRSALFQIQAAAHSLMLGRFEDVDRYTRVASSVASSTSVASDLLSRVRVLSELAATGAIEGARRIAVDHREGTDPSTFSDFLADFPELLMGGSYAEFVDSLDVTASDPAYRCTCHALKGWAHSLAGRTAAAQAQWDSLAVELREGSEDWVGADEAWSRAQLAVALARAGRQDEAREELGRSDALIRGGSSPPASPLSGRAWGGLDYVRAEAVAALGDAEAAAALLAPLVAQAKGITPEYLSVRFAWDAIRDHPAFEALAAR